MRAHLLDPVGGPRVKGAVGLYRIWTDGSGRIDPLSFRCNQIQISWGYIAAMCIGLGDRKYRIQGLYLEYENVADPDDAITPPDFAKEDGVEYYADLLYSGSRDYLRVPLIQAPLLGIETGDEAYFTAGETGNKLTFFTQSQGTQGVHGKAFGDSANSKIFGCALVAIPDFQDKTKDVVFARTYFETADQVAKLPSSQLGVTWDISFIGVP